jgi:hypothetical protein
MLKNDEPLPDSSHEIWEGGERLDMLNEAVPMGKKHVWHMKGHKAYCTSCPFEHALYLSPKQEVRDGNIVDKIVIGK